MTVLISDFNLERGSGKTTLALRLMAACDNSPDGVTPDKATLSAHELQEAYTSQPPRSSLLLDEGQAGLSNRRAMSGINEAMRRIVGMGRVERKYLFLTSPGVHQIDADIRAMCDIWIFVRELGKGEVFRVRYNPFRQQVRTKSWGTITWDAELPGQLQETYEQLTDEKRKRLRGEGGDGEGYVDADEVQETVESARKEAKQQTRNELLRQIYETSDDVDQSELADAVGLARSTVGNIIRGEYD